MVSASDFQLKGRWLVARLVSSLLCCFLRQETLLLHPGVSMGTGDIPLVVTLRWPSIPSRGNSNTPSCSIEKNLHVSFSMSYQKFNTSHFYRINSAYSTFLVVSCRHAKARKNKNEKCSLIFNIPNCSQYKALCCCIKGIHSVLTGQFLH